MNLKIKFRESFRPFAPAVLAEHLEGWFDHDEESPYMLLVAGLDDRQLLPVPADQCNLSGIDRLKIVRSTLPAVTHVDGSARLQTVNARTSPRFHALLQSFYRLTGCPVLINTSFNVRGEPIVCTPEDAYRCFMRTQMDHLVVGNNILAKFEQPEHGEASDGFHEFELD